MTPSTAALRKTALVTLPPDAAFELFVDHIARWWPLATHSVGMTSSRSVHVEHGVGGRIIETIEGGDTAVWGTVEVWEPPNRLRFTWHPGTSPEEATEVEVTFVESSEGTSVVLVHSGWDRRPDGPDSRANYDGGWDLVLGRYASAGAGSLVRPSPN